jgi:nucleoside-diphosphate-sugar epimerase
VVTISLEAHAQTVRPDRERPLLEPVVINGSTGWLGRALRQRLATSPLEVRPVEAPGDLLAACHDAGSVVHLGGGVLSRARSVGTVLEATEALVDSVTGSAIERIVFISTAGASPRARSEYLRATANAEACLHAFRRDLVILRCTHVFGPPEDPGEVVEALRADSRHRVAVIGSGSQRVAPVYREDVLDAIVAALDPRTYHGRFDLPGPEVMTMDQLARAVNPDTVTIRHVPRRGARLFTRASRLRPELIDLMATESLGEQLRAERAFGLVRRRVSDVYWPGGSGSSSSPSASA